MRLSALLLKSKSLGIPRCCRVIIDRDAGVVLAEGVEVSPERDQDELSALLCLEG